MAVVFLAAVFSAAVSGCSPAVFFATMAAAPSHIVILLANRAGTINRLGSRGNGARRPIRPPTARRAANMHALCPAPRPVIRRAGPRPGPPGAGRPAVAFGSVPPVRKPVGRCPRGAVHWAERKAWMGTSSGVRSPERPGDGGSPGASAT
ncbi:hypothetical protein EF907_01535 [Streptomyces sp. WAC06273]|nr:hypothetical protein EF915_24205 [Streptomyces sp. WAC08401]RSS71044.1 hypothetical protein EF907_01535 [Streptomyces sp. WAC06273]